MWVKRGELDLTYCTNIHAGESWREVRASVGEYAPPLKRRLSPEAPFGLGLRLSAVAARELVEGNALQEFKQFLVSNGLYVALINGFPYGAFHGEVVKTEVFAPDWLDPARLRYTLDLAGALSELLPEGMSGGISTIPLSYKPWISDREAVWPVICSQLAELAAELVRLRTSTGRRMHLDIEPEPDGLLENTDELLAFFGGPLMEHGAPALARCLGVSLSKAEDLLREHIQVCFDVCHIAVQFEEPVASLRRLQQQNIGIGRIQVSSALCVKLEPQTSPAELAKRLAPLADKIYLHQVVERDEDGTLRRFADLGDALASRCEGRRAEWRIHFHVPLFTEHLRDLVSTQAENERVLRYAAANDVTAHLEVETYTWHVLPKELKLDLLSSIEREVRWVLEQVPVDELCTRR